MKTATIPSLRVDPSLREAAEGVLMDGETLSAFVEQSIRDSVHRRQAQSEFIARAMASRDEARRTGAYVSAQDVVKGLELKLAAAKRKAKARA
jgi:predicted transcriptional regulator